MTTSLEISKKLYVVFPEWDDTDKGYWNGELILLETHHREVDIKGNGTKYFTPAYDSDYLMDKLDFIKLESKPGGWKATRLADAHKSRSDISVHADTPADALALLAIKLREDKIL